MTESTVIKQCVIKPNSVIINVRPAIVIDGPSAQKTKFMIVKLDKCQLNKRIGMKKINSYW